jgi:hypothetical protein
VNPLTGWGPVTVNSSTPIPAYLSASIITAGSPSMTAMTRIVATGTRAAAGTLRATISVGFSAKNR